MNMFSNFISLRASAGSARTFSAVVLLAVTMFPGAIFAQTGGVPEALREARRVMALQPEAAKKHIATLSPTEARNLLSQVRFIARKNNPDLDKVYYLVQHLETLKATDLAQRRLNNLLLVLGLTLLLFTAFLGYVILDQRRTMIRLKQMLGNRASESPAGDVYRGE